MTKQDLCVLFPLSRHSFFGVLIVTLILAVNVRSACCQEFKSSVVGTDFDFITAEDPSAFKSLKFVKSGKAEMPDKRDDDASLFQQAFTFEASFKDQTKVRIYIDADFETQQAAESEARRYVDRLGKLPVVLRKGVSRLVVHHGGEDTTAFSDVGLIVVYADNATKRISTHDLEETIFHESVHAAWDAKHAKSANWKRAQMADGVFATVYAQRKPALEDLAESALFAYTILNNPERIPEPHLSKLRTAIPNRIAFVGELLQPAADPE